MKMHRTTAALGAGVLAAGLAACGSNGEESGGSVGSGGNISEETATAIEGAYAGTFGEPPSSSPKAQPGKNIWLIMSSAQVADFSEPGHMVDAAKAMGWELTVFDGQYNPDTMINGLRQAVADKADGIITFTADCEPLKAGLKDVVEAKIPVVGFESIDCNEAVDDDGNVTDTGRPGMFDAVVTYENPDDESKPLTYVQFIGDQWVRAQALGIIEATDGKAKLIQLKESDYAITLAQGRGFEDALSEYCPDCEIVDTVDLVGTDIGAGLRDKVAQSLAQHPEANAIYGTYDAVALDVAPAVMASGRNDDIFVMGGEGSTALIDLIAGNRGIDAGAGIGFRWEAYAALDAMNRLLAGERPEGVGFPSGIGVQLFDSETNMPEEGTRFDGPVDFESKYYAAWGIDDE